MAQQDTADVPHLIVLAPAAYTGRRIELSRDRLIIGRESTCDVRFDDPHVSRTHAALERRGNAVYVQDLGSSGGTFINETPAAGRELRSGDVIRFATVQARYEAAAQAGTVQMPMPMPTRAPAVSYAIGSQQADAINNVGRDQYLAYFQQVVHERDGFIREVTAAKTKARWLIVFGFVIFLAGAAMFIIPGLNFDKQVEDQISSGTAGPVADAGGPQILGMTMQDLGWVLAAIGIVIMGIGSVLHQVAVARRKRVDREHPLPLPWQPLQ